jgi:N-acetylglutamate synthase-like GNAT family acetyltransferase
MKPRVTTNKNELDIEFVHQFLTTAYWAKGRTKQEVEKTINNSLCFGIYLNNKQIGFARVVSDYTIFAYIMDVFIAEEFRGNGYSKILMEYVMKEPSLKDIQRWGLATVDAHFLYKKFGFTQLEHPERMMLKLVK